MTSSKSNSPAKRGRPAKLTIEKIVDCALEMGLGQVSMHQVAKALGVSTTALYRHVANKDELIALCTDLVSQDVMTPRTEDWKAFLYELSRAYRQAALARPGSVEFMRYVGMQTPHAIGVFDHALGILRKAGFDREAAFMAVAGVISHATDMVLHEELAKQRAIDQESLDLAALASLPNVLWAMESGAGFDHEQNFETGLQIIIEGIEVVFARNG